MTTLSEDDMLLAEGACFGWFSSVNNKCQPSSCLQSARCQQYTVTMQQTNGLLDLKSVTTTDEVKEQAVQAEESVSTDDIVQRAFFEHVMNALIQNIQHDEVHYDPTHTWATLKNARLVVCFVIRSRKCVRVKLGGSKENNRPELEIEMGVDIDHMKRVVAEFLEKQR